jgi:GMP synthase-like glutamine amidotransferase
MTLRPILVVQHEADAPPARVGDWLTAAGAELDIRCPFAGDELPTDFSEHSGLVVMGGAVGAYDDLVAPWLPATRALLGRAVREQVPTFAICLGAQLLTVATGGRVERGADGPEIGAHLIAKRTAAATDPLFGPLPILPDVLQWHYDAITALPPSAILLASSPLYEVQAFRVGRLAWGVQCHIETTPEQVREWARTDPEMADYDLTRILDRSDAVHPDIAEAWQPLVERFVEVVRAPDGVSAATGPPVSVAAPIDDPAAIRAALAREMMQGSGGPTPLGMPTLAPPAQRHPATAQRPGGETDRP